MSNPFKKRKFNYVDALISAISSRIRRGKNGKKDKDYKPKIKLKSKGIMIIPDDLPEIKEKLFEAYTKNQRLEFFKKLIEFFPKNAKTIYKMFALETRHFKSSQFLWTGSAGMEVHKEAYPYGWTIAKNTWKGSNLRPIGFKVFTDKANRKRAFLAFKTPLSFASVLNDYINKYGAGRWRSTDPEKQKAYVAVLARIKTPKIT